LRWPSPGSTNESCRGRINYAEIDPDQALFARSFLDVCVHYSRPDLLWLGTDTRERKLKIETLGEGDEAALGAAV
jgi:hypothetical protein